MADEFLDQITPQALLGVGFGVVAAWCTGYGNIAIKRDCKQVAKLKHKKEEIPQFYRRQFWFHISGSYLLGAVFQFAAFSYAPFSLITPTSSFTIVVNIIFARTYLGEALRKTEQLGTSMILLGCSMLVFFGSERAFDRNWHAFIELARRAEFLLFVAIHGGIMICSLIIIQLLKPKPPTDLRASLLGRVSSPKKSGPQHVFRAICFAIVTSGLAVWVNLAMKAGIGLIKDTTNTDLGENQFDGESGPFILVLIGIPFLSGLLLRFMVEMMSKYEAVFIIPFCQFFFVFTLQVCSPIYFDRDVSAKQRLVFVVSLAVAFVGILILSLRAFQPVAKTKPVRMRRLSEMTISRRPSEIGSWGVDMSQRSYLESQRSYLENLEDLELDLEPDSQERESFDIMKARAGSYIPKHYSAGSTHRSLSSIYSAKQSNTWSATRSAKDIRVFEAEESKTDQVDSLAARTHED